MKIQIGVEPGTNYTFYPKTTNAAHIIISGIDIKKDNILAVINVTRGVVAMMCNKTVPEYQIDPILNLIWLSCTEAEFFEETDQFMILMEVPARAQDTALLEAVQLMRKMTYLLESSGNVDSSNRQRIAVEVIPTVGLSTTTGAGIVGQGYPVTACTVGGNPYTLTAAQPTQMVATIVDQRIGLEIDMQVAAGLQRSKLSWN